MLAAPVVPVVVAPSGPPSPTATGREPPAYRIQRRAAFFQRWLRRLESYRKGTTYTTDDTNAAGTKAVFTANAFLLIFDDPYIESEYMASFYSKMLAPLLFFYRCVLFISFCAGIFWFFYGHFWNDNDYPVGVYFYGFMTLVGNVPAVLFSHYAAKKKFPWAYAWYPWSSIITHAISIEFMFISSVFVNIAMPANGHRDMVAIIFTYLSMILQLMCRKPFWADVYCTVADFVMFTLLIFVKGYYEDMQLSASWDGCINTVANLLFNGILVPSSLVAMRLYYSYIQDDFTRHRFISERIVLHEVDVQKVANEEKTAFLAQMSHEIRNPLSVIIGYTQLVQEEPDNVMENEERLSKIMLTSNRLKRIVDDLLDFTVMEDQRLTLNPKPCLIPTLVEEVMDSVSIMAIQKGFNISSYSHIPASCSNVILDAERLQQVLYNLLDNSLKYTVSGEVMLVVEACETPDKGVFYLFRTLDTGMGIAPDKLHKLFKTKVVHINTMGPVGRVKSYGLGLPLSNHLVSLMHGGIWCDSGGHKKGSIFSFTINAPSSASNGSGIKRDQDTPPPQYDAASDSPIRPRLLAKDRVSSQQSLMLQRNGSKQSNKPTTGNVAVEMSPLSKGETLDGGPRSLQSSPRTLRYGFSRLRSSSHEQLARIKPKPNNVQTSGIGGEIGTPTLWPTILRPNVTSEIILAVVDTSFSPTLHYALVHDFPERKTLDVVHPNEHHVVVVVVVFGESWWTPVPKFVERMFGVGSLLDVHLDHHHDKSDSETKAMAQSTSSLLQHHQQHHGDGSPLLSPAASPRAQHGKQSDHDLLSMEPSPPSTGSNHSSTSPLAASLHSHSTSFAAPTTTTTSASAANPPRRANLNVDCLCIVLTSDHLFGLSTAAQINSFGGGGLVDILVQPHSASIVQTVASYVANSRSGNPLVLVFVHRNILTANKMQTQATHHRSPTPTVVLPDQPANHGAEELFRMVKNTPDICDHVRFVSVQFRRLSKANLSRTNFDPDYKLQLPMRTDELHDLLQLSIDGALNRVGALKGSDLQPAIAVDAAAPIKEEQPQPQASMQSLLVPVAAAPAAATPQQTFDPVAHAKMLMSRRPPASGAPRVRPDLLKGVRVLYAEDEEANRMFTTRFIEKHQGKVYQAVNGEEAFKLVQASRDDPFDVVLMDVNMPLMDGYEATRAIREYEAVHGLPNVHIIALTARAFEVDVQAALDSGMNQVLKKPFLKDDMLLVVREGADKSAELRRNTAL